MPHVTSLGHVLEYPYRILDRPMPKWTEADKDFVSKYQRLFNILCSVDNYVITLREENKRLQHENEFMLRLINERENNQ